MFQVPSAFCRCRLHGIVHSVAEETACAKKRVWPFGRLPFLPVAFNLGMMNSWAEPVDVKPTH